MKFKKSVLMVVGLVMLLFVTACGGGNEASSGSEESSGDKKTIGVSISNLDEFLTYMQDAMKEEAENHPDFEFIYSDAQNDSARQMDQIENFITRNVDAIVINPVDTTAAVDIINLVNNAGIPIIVANRTFDGVEEATAYVGSESIQSGLLQMEEVAELLGGEGNIAIMEGMLGHEAQIKRTEGNIEIIDQHDGLEVVLQNTAKFDRSEGMRLMENWLNSGADIDAVVANNDEMALGAILALEAAGKLEDVLVAGIDATPAALESMKAGQLGVTVFQDAKGQGANSIITAVKAANGEEVEDVLVPYQLVTPENVDEYIAKYE
ncbi:inositol transport system sugar-binding protein [Halalkalibacter wakoensis JCM 9140]|uniref:Inositol transport system sugar-binding protein n=1 Tax=Halalkalibacter wakoensis JCM 9140 TaxID=1236970 RepID=W4Q7Q7_9BACI|nr:sugar ABC transporter substrate-binding protein [Halalkalibacter wakoensis]GAE27980.1 inositol transport system sugar-binding protein [Halalkalibacter wakoensis JCM 9140]